MSMRAMRWAYGLFEVADIPHRERAVLLVLCWDHTDAEGCFPSQERIAKLVGLRERRVRDLIHALEDMGLITRSKRRTGGKYTGTDYQLFGTYRRQTGAGGKAAHHRHSTTGGHHRRTGADYRGSIKGGGNAPELRVIGGLKK